MIHSFWLGVQPLPTPRPRFRGIISGGRPLAVAYPDPAYKRWMGEAAAALQGLEVPAFNPDGLFSVAITVFITKARTSKLLTPLGDLDNYAKGVLDAITKDGRWWTDDKLVQLLQVEKDFAVGEPGYDVVISQKVP